MSLNYTNLRNVNGDYEYERHGKPIKIYGGKLVENIIQALARIVITNALLEVNKLDNLHVAFTVHDEIIAVGPKQNPDSTMQTITEMMEVRPPWASSLPLAVEGGYAERYSK
jgi:DNA polymerase